MDNRIKIEQKFLWNTERLIQNLLDKEFQNKDVCLDAFSKHRIKDLVNRMIHQEVEYLHDDPKNYFEIYGQDFLDN